MNIEISGCPTSTPSPTSFFSPFLYYFFKQKVMVVWNLESMGKILL
jgi:hypothetical protein